jgi:hypothetical protein
MAFTVYGTGTTFIGERDYYARDGSYVTTEWMVVFFIPLVPLRSLRVVPAGVDPRWHWWHRYHQLAELPLSGRQVLSVYGFVVGCAAWLTCWWQALDLVLQLTFLMGAFGGVVFFAFWLAIILSPFAVPLYLRRRAMRRAGW